MSPINQKIQRFLQSTWPPKAASALLLILFSWWAFANILPFFEEKEITPAPQVVKTTKTPEQFSLKNLDLFGEPEKDKAVNKTSEAKQTKLSLTLRGVLATDDPKQGIAQIQNAKKQERHFAVSDSVFGQATLEEIHADHVILLHNGRYETLVLPEKFLNVKHFSAEQLKLSLMQSGYYVQLVLTGYNNEKEVIMKPLTFKD
jgi:type II secretion system protein C